MAATTQVQILVWTQGYGSSCRHSHVMCALVCVTIFHDLLAISRDIAARHVTVIEDNMDRRRSPDDPGILVPLQMFREDFGSRSTSSSGQDVALWPRQPRFNSWCGHRAMALLADMLMLGVCVCARGIYLCHDLPASFRDIATFRVTAIVDNLEKRRSSDDLGCVVPLRFFRTGFHSRSTSSSRRGVASWTT